MIRAILLLFSALLLSCASFAQGAEASAALSADKDRLIVGDQARVVLAAQHDPSRSSLVWPAVPDSFGKLEVVVKDKIDTIREGRFVQYRQLLLVSGFDSGVFSIPPFRLSVAPKAGAPYEIQTGGLELHVQTVPVDTTKPFKPIKGIMAVETSWQDYIWWIAGGILALVAIGLIVYFLRRKKPAIPPPPPAPQPAHERALQQLEALEREALWQKGEVKAYYVRLTDILRSYIEARFGVRAMERTTDELLGAAERHPGLSLHTDKLYRILSTADMAKFARAQPLAAEHVAAMEAARALIVASIPPGPAQQPDAQGAKPLNPPVQP